MKEIQIDKKTKLRVIDYYCPFAYLLKYSDYDYENLGVCNHSHSIFCMFHENTITPSARIYPKSEEQESEHIFCFSENKLYYPHDLCADYSKIIKYSSDYVFQAIWDRLNDDEKSIFLGNNEYHSSNLIKFKNEFLKYKLNEIDLNELIKIIYINEQ